MRRAGAGTAATKDSGPPRCARARRSPVQLRCLIVDDDQGFLDAARLLLERAGVLAVAFRSRWR
jgi:hypothetical protein